MEPAPQPRPAAGAIRPADPVILPPPAPDGREDCVCFLLRSAARRASALYSRHLAQIGLGLPQHSLVGMAAAFEKRNGRPASITELARALDLDRTTLTRNLRPMVAAGLVTLEPAGRAKAVRATREGRQAYRAGIALWRQAQDEMLGALGAAYPGLAAGLAAAIAGMPAPADLPADPAAAGED
ncbi:MarR family winged helix-turn-helix transcriptional regulator [Ferrovibrio sp.]|uniref:MarR family winged helix-turn-helix transcriptional regulator n=1 Tax=Ferrovibrio sp. TaxID=1917215 RepID=UPI00311DE236